MPKQSGKDASNNSGTSTGAGPQNLQEILAMGEQANQLLNSQAYNLAYRMQMDQIIEQWLTSDPKHSNFREGLFHKARGLMDSAHTLGGMVTQAQEVLQKQSEEQNPDQRHSNYMDTQGYGLDFVN